MKLSHTLACLFVTALAAVPGFARTVQDPLAPWLDALLEGPAMRSDDRDARAAQLLALVERSPEHPLTELVLRALRSNAVDDPAPHLARCMALDASALRPPARGELEALRLTTAFQLAAAGKPAPSDVGVDRIAPTLVLGPLPDCYDRAAKLALLADARFDAAHRGYPGESPRWTPVETRRPTLYTDPDALVDAEYGWGAVAFAFELERGGPAWVELDFSGDVGPSWTTLRAWQDGGALSTIDDPSVDLRINDEPPQRIDFLGEERAWVVRLPTVAHDGANRVLVVLNLGARVSFSLRLLDVEGRAYPQVRRLTSIAPLGQRPQAQAPSQPLEDAAAWLEARASESPTARALLGLAQLLRGQSLSATRSLESAAAADPSLIGAKTVLADHYNGECFAPQAWARAQARKLFDELAPADPNNVRVATALAETLAAEDREEQAFALVRAGEASAPNSPEQPLALSRLYSRLELEAPAERALLDAGARAPRSQRVLGALASHWSRLGLDRREARERERLVSEAGNVGALAAAAQAFATLGEVERALELRRRAAELGGDDELDALGEYLQSLGRFDEARDAFTRLAERRPLSSSARERLADLALLQGDREGALRHIEAALALAPGDLELRTVARELGWTDPAHAFFERWNVDTRKELADFDATRWSEHVVRAIDAAAVYVFEDGSWAQLNHSRSVARDLEGCEALGKQGEREEMLRIATIKADGAEYEPVLVDGEYVMPALEPGDTVESLWLDTGGVDREGRLVLGTWSFASIDEPFHLSRYVVSLPKSLELELVLRNFDGKHETIDEGARVTHVFELRNVARVVPEPLAPTPTWYLPWVQLGMQRSRASIAEQARVDLAAALRPTPILVEAVQRATAGISGQEAQARALHAFTAQALDKRGNAFSSATAALLQRDGNPSILYAALLAAAGIDHDLVWSRGVDPRADQDPDPAFPDLNRWFGRMLVVVRPDDGPAVWCNVGAKTMPYGEMLLDSPLAEALSARTGEFLSAPDAPLEQLAGESTRVSMSLRADRSAQIEIDFGPTGNVGDAWKEGLREAPKAQLKQLATRITTSLVRGFELAEFEWSGLESDAELRLVAKGAHKRYLDEQKGELSCKLPFPALQMSGLARGEGQRTQPFLFPQSLARSWSVRIELEEGLKLEQGVEDVSLDFGDARFRQTLRPDGERAFVLERSLFAPPLKLAPEQFAGLVAFCKQLDDLDRAKLRFARIE